jgi:8-oxo-dGTP diphosphatase
LRVAELVRNDGPAVRAALAVHQVVGEPLLVELPSGVLLTLQLRRRGWDRRPRSAVLNRMLRSLNAIVEDCDRVLVVGAVIERDGLVLAAQRAHPEQSAGKWEFPGGKAEFGESAVTALQRECQEELAVSVIVGAELARVELDTGALLVLLAATLPTGTEPAALEHLQLRWCRPDELGELDWLTTNAALAADLASGRIDAS